MSHRCGAVRGRGRGKAGINERRRGSHGKKRRRRQCNRTDHSRPDTSFRALWMASLARASLACLDSLPGPARVRPGHYMSSARNFLSNLAKGRIKRLGQRAHEMTIVMLATAWIRTGSITHDISPNKQRIRQPTLYS